MEETYVACAGQSCVFALNLKRLVRCVWIEIACLLPTQETCKITYSCIRTWADSEKESDDYVDCRAGSKLVGSDACRVKTPKA